MHTLGGIIGGINYLWSFGDGESSTEFSPSHMFIGTQAGYTVTLTVSTAFGCSDSTEISIGAQVGGLYYIPNAFTPDLDMNNDEFIIRYHALQEETFKLDIYDRFGSLVHTSNDPNSSWDGTNDFSGNKLMTGVYTYYISYQDFEGRIYDHTTCENCTGTISLMR